MYSTLRYFSKVLVLMIYTSNSKQMVASTLYDWHLSSVLKTGNGGMRYAHCTRHTLMAMLVQIFV